MFLQMICSEIFSIFIIIPMSVIWRKYGEYYLFGDLLHFQKNSHVCDMKKIRIGMLFMRDNLLDSELHDCLWNKYSYEVNLRLFVNKVFSNYSFWI